MRFEPFRRTPEHIEVKGSAQIITIVTTLAQGVPGLKAARTVCCMGNWSRSSPQNPTVDERPDCKKVTKVTCTEVPFSPMTALSCTTLTVPLTLEELAGRAPRVKMFPQPGRVKTRQSSRKERGISWTESERKLD